jgi:hypothetical protein
MPALYRVADAFGIRRARNTMTRKPQRDKTTLGLNATGRIAIVELTSCEESGVF